MKRPEAPTPPPCRIMCSCGRTVPEDVWQREHRGCARKMQLIGDVIIGLIFLGFALLCVLKLSGIME